MLVEILPFIEFDGNPVDAADATVGPPVLDIFCSHTADLVLSRMLQEIVTGVIPFASERAKRLAP